MESHSCWKCSDGYFNCISILPVIHFIPIDFWYWLDYLAYIYFDYQVIPKVNIDISQDTIFCLKKSYSKDIKLKWHAKYYMYYNDMLCCNKKGGYDVTLYFSYIVAVNFIGGGNRSTRRKPSICSKSLTNFLPYI